MSLAVSPSSFLLHATKHKAGDRRERGMKLHFGSHLGTASRKNTTCVLSREQEGRTYLQMSRKALTHKRILPFIWNKAGRIVLHVRAGGGGSRKSGRSTGRSFCFLVSTPTVFSFLTPILPQ